MLLMAFPTAWDYINLHNSDKIWHAARCFWCSINKLDVHLRVSAVPHD